MEHFDTDFIELENGNLLLSYYDLQSSHSTNDNWYKQVIRSLFRYVFLLKGLKLPSLLSFILFRCLSPYIL